LLFAESILLLIILLTFISIISVILYEETQDKMNIFRHSPTMEEATKQAKRDVTRTQRGLSRDSSHLDREEKQLMAKIQQASKTGNQNEVKALAKQVVLVRKEKEKLSVANARLGAVKTQATMVNTTYKMSQAMAETSKTMKQVNKAANPEKMQANMMEFQRQTAAVEFNEEAMDDMLSNAFDEEEDDQEADEIVRRTLEEIGIDATKALGVAPRGKIKTGEEETDEETERIMKQLLGS